MHIQHYPLLKLFQRGPKDIDYVGDILNFQHMHFPAIGMLLLCCS